MKYWCAEAGWPSGWSKQQCEALLTRQASFALRLLWMHEAIAYYVF